MQRTTRNTLADSETRALLAHVNARIATGELQLLYLNRFSGVAPDEAYLREVAQVKRFLEWWCADVEFRTLLETDADAAVAKLGLPLRAAELKYLWDEETALSTPVGEIASSALRYRSFILEKIHYRQQLRSDEPTTDRRFTTWRRRQMRRVENELSELAASSIVHAPFTIELCHGCSVGCWFCGIAAPRLDEIALYSPENARLFEAMLDALDELLGKAAGRGFLYWATDPMDNPDYEHYLVAFHDRLNAFPQTTTALPLKNIDRTRALLELSRSRQGMMDRFSLLSLKQLERVHAAFTPEELVYVELVTQNRESHQPKARAGRALVEISERPLPSQSFVGNQTLAGTIACVSGFLISMVNRTVKLISPCEASAKWPLGYIVFDERQFANGAEFREAIFGMVDQFMLDPLHGNESLAFHEFLEPIETPEGLLLKGRHYDTGFNDDVLFQQLGREIRTTNKTVDEIAETLSERLGCSPADVYYAIGLLMDHGLLDARHAMNREEASVTR